MSEIEFEATEDGIGSIRLNRPQKRNAFTTGMREDLAEILSSERMDTLTAIVLHAEGHDFSAGADLREVKDIESWHHRGAATRLFSSLRRSGPVLIASVQGHALGLGCGLALACDFVVAEETACFGYPEVQHGLVAAITMVGLKEQIGNRKAFELLLTGRRISPAEAMQLGMINEVVGEGEGHTRALEIARDVASAGDAARVMKRFFYESNDMPYMTALHSAERVIEATRSSKRAREGAASFASRKSS